MTAIKIFYKNHNIKSYRLIIEKLAFLFLDASSFLTWGEMWGSNPRIPEPQSGVLTTSPIPPFVVLE